MKIPLLPFMAVVSLGAITQNETPQPFKERHKKKPLRAPSCNPIPGNRSSKLNIILTSKSSSFSNQNQLKARPSLSRLAAPILQAIVASSVAGLTFPLQSLTIGIMYNQLSLRDIPKTMFPFIAKDISSFIKGYSILTGLRFSQVFFNALGTFYGSSSGSSLACVLSKQTNTNQANSFHKLFRTILPVLGGSLLGMGLSYHKEINFIAKSASILSPAPNSLFLMSIFAREALLTTALLHSRHLNCFTTLGIGAMTSIFNSLAIMAVADNLTRDLPTKMALAIPLRMLYVSIAAKAQASFNNHIFKA